MQLDHLVLNVNNTEALLAFYNKILGLCIENHERFERKKVSFPTLRINKNSILNLFPPERWKTPDNDQKKTRNNMNHFCLAMSKKEWIDLKNRLNENHINIIIGPVESAGAKGPGCALHFRDPEDNQIEVRYYEQA
jgi:glyoxylase I family protein